MTKVNILNTPQFNWQILEALSLDFVNNMWVNYQIVYLNGRKLKQMTLEHWAKLIKTVLTSINTSVCTAHYCFNI
jgi:hypothetical protein